MLKITSPSELDALLLLDAQALIERGWCQNALTDAAGNVCALGALYEAKFGTPYAPDVVGRPYSFLAQAIGNRDVADWNNAPERTQAEVVEAFGKAAELARAEA